MQELWRSLHICAWDGRIDSVLAVRISETYSPTNKRGPDRFCGGPRLIPGSEFDDNDAYTTYLHLLMDLLDLAERLEAPARMALISYDLVAGA